MTNRSTFSSGTNWTSQRSFGGKDQDDRVRKANLAVPSLVEFLELVPAFFHAKKKVKVKGGVTHASTMQKIMVKVTIMEIISFDQTVFLKILL